MFEFVIENLKKQQSFKNFAKYFLNLLFCKSKFKFLKFTIVENRNQKNNIFLK